MGEGHAEIGPQGLPGTPGGPPRQGFELGKHLLYGIEGGTVGREKQKGGAPLRKELGTDRILMDREVIQDDEVPGAERRP